MYRRQSEDSQQRPLSNPDYHAPGTQTPETPSYEPKDHSYGANYRNPLPTTMRSGGARRTSGRRKWLILGGVVLALAIVGGVVGGVVGSENHKSSKKTSDSTNGGSGSSNGGPGTTNGTTNPASGLGSGSQNNFVPYSYNSNGLPLYSTSTVSAALTTPTFLGSSSNLSCPFVTLPSGFTSSGSGATLTVRPDHPRIVADGARFDCVKSMISQDAYLAGWNETIFANATKYAAMAPTNYTIDGGLSGSGVLDPSREVQLRIKHWGYAWRMSNDTKWAERAWQEILVASGNTTQYFGTAGDNWNIAHFLDVAEFTMAFALAYDWFYDYWSADQKTAIMWSIITNGLQQGIAAYNGNGYGWWAENTEGNWNCVCNNGLLAGAIAIWGDDPTDSATTIMGNAITSAQANCFMATWPDGSWAETANYWYFGMSAAAEMASTLETATGSTQGIYDNNPASNLSGVFHMYVSGYNGMFDYGDCGPNKYTATANNLLYSGRYFDVPMYTLFQRDQQDATEPYAMLWYDPTVTGAWWEGLPLDRNFDYSNSAWVSARSSWTNYTGMFFAMKAANVTGHQTHGDLDMGTFVFDALGQRWAGELCQAQYLADGYFSSEAQDSERWIYYRTRTEGQNTLVLNYQNSLVNVVSPTTYGSTGETQPGLDGTLPSTSTVFYTADMTTSYNDTSIKRGMRFLNGRNQLLLQDEITDSAYPVQWRMHTNATIDITNDNKTATLTLGGETVIATLLEDGEWSTAQPVRYSTDPALPTDAISQDLPNPGVTVLTITVDAGTWTLAVLFNPQWPGWTSDDFITPPSVPLSNWTLTSHNVDN